MNGTCQSPNQKKPCRRSGFSRHTRRSEYRCFLPVLAGLTGPHCARPDLRQGAPIIPQPRGNHDIRCRNETFIRKVEFIGRTNVQAASRWEGRSVLP